MSGSSLTSGNRGKSARIRPPEDQDDGVRKVKLPRDNSKGHEYDEQADYQINRMHLPANMALLPAPNRAGNLVIHPPGSFWGEAIGRASLPASRTYHR
jgi:hypothetical protein